MAAVAKWDGAEDEGMMDNQRILLIEDQPVVRTALKAMLANNNTVELHEADSGNTALRFLRSALPHVILCDINMPNGDGFHLVKKLRQHPHKLFDIPIIFLTSSNEPGMVQKASDTGVDGYMLKPATAERMRDVIAKAMKRRGMAIPFSQMRVLVVDDDMMARVAIRATLAGLGCAAVSDAMNGEDAYFALRQQLPTLVISDIEMPDGDGLEFLQGLRSTPHSLFNFPIIFLTGNRHESCVKMAANLGVDGYLLKPISSSKLRTTISEVIGRRTQNAGSALA